MTPPTRVLAPAPACTTCRAPLAADQRFCLHCGTRRPEARLSFLDVLAEDQRAPAPFALPAPLAEPARGSFGGAPTVNLALLLVATLGVGLAVGHWATDRSTPPIAAAPAPQVIRVEAPAAAAPAVAATATDAAAGADAPAKASSAKKAKTVAAPKGATNAKTLSKKAIDDLAKKGKPLSTGGGKLPPKDKKAPAGGSDFETIG